MQEDDDIFFWNWNTVWRVRALEFDAFASAKEVLNFPTAAKLSVIKNQIKKLGRSGNRTLDLSLPKGESYY